MHPWYHIQQWPVGEERVNFTLTAGELPLSDDSPFLKIPPLMRRGGTETGESVSLSVQFRSLSIEARFPLDRSPILITVLECTDFLAQKRKVWSLGRFGWTSRSIISEITQNFSVINDVFNGQWCLQRLSLIQIFLTSLWDLLRLTGKSNCNKHRFIFCFSALVFSARRLVTLIFDHMARATNRGRNCHAL